MRLRPLARQLSTRECTWRGVTCPSQGTTRSNASSSSDQRLINTVRARRYSSAPRATSSAQSKPHGRTSLFAGAFSHLLNGCPLSRARFVELVRSALARAGVPIAGYSGHSFRIGAATAAAQSGIPDSAIQALGHWSSPAFLRYIRDSREHLAQYSHPFANALGHSYIVSVVVNVVCSTY